jgi:hypothetical protein
MFLGLFCFWGWGGGEKIGDLVLLVFWLMGEDN